MFNESQKRKYIEEMKDRNSTIESIMNTFFAKTERIETVLQKDCSEFNINDIFDVLMEVDTYSYNYLNNMVSQLKLYTAWCISNARTETFINHYQLITSDMVRQCINDVLLNDSIISKEKLDYYMSNLINPSDKFILLASFEGINIEEIMRCKISDLYFVAEDEKIINANSCIQGEKISKGLIDVNGKRHDVSSDLIKIGIESYNELNCYPQRYIGDTVDSFNGKQIKAFKYDDRIIKPMLNSRVDEDEENDSILGARFRYKMRRIKEIANGATCMSWKNLQLSGIVYATKVALRKQTEINDIKTFLLTKYESEIKEKFNIIYPAARLYEKYEKYFENEAEL